MANKEFEKSIGDKIDQSMREDEVAMLGDLLNPPSQETIDMWTREADKRIQKKYEQRKKVLALAAVVTFVCISMVMVVKGLPMPEAEAGPENKAQIEQTMESTTQYESWDKLPEDIKEQFIEFKEFPEGYELEYVEVVELSHYTRITYHLLNDNEKELYIREVVSSDGILENNVVEDDSEVIKILENYIYVKMHKSNIEKTTYSLKHDKIMIDIIVPCETNETNVLEIIEKAIL